MIPSDPKDVFLRDWTSADGECARSCDLPREATPSPDDLAAGVAWLREHVRNESPAPAILESLVSYIRKYEAMIRGLEHLRSMTKRETEGVYVDLFREKEFPT